MDQLLGLTSPLGFDPTAASMSPQSVAPQYAPQAPQAAPQAAPQGYQPPHGIKAILGMLGDAMLIAHGQQPMYQNRINQERENAALSGFLTNPDQAIQQLMQVDPKAGISLYSQVHPKSEIPEGVREYSYYNNLPDAEKPAFEKFLTLTHPGMMTPITLGPTDTYESGGTPAASGPPANAVQYLKAHPELAPHFDQKYGAGAAARALAGGGATASPSPTFPVSKVMDALTNQESGGNGLAVSPKGALGSTQMLPGTAQQMAEKLGLPFRPDMLHSNDPSARRYQRALGSAYLQEGLARTGNLRDALRYYHGGPDTAQWGPKTNAYADSVLSLLGRQ